jgi:hypothetical protein
MRVRDAALSVKKADGRRPPAGPGWIHEIKHDGFRILAHRSGDRVQLLTRAGNNFAGRFPLIAAAIHSVGLFCVNLEHCDDCGRAARIILDALGQSPTCRGRKS